MDRFLLVCVYFFTIRILTLFLLTTCVIQRMSFHISLYKAWRYLLHALRIWPWNAGRTHLMSTSPLADLQNLLQVQTKIWQNRWVPSPMLNVRGKREAESAPNVMFTSVDVIVRPGFHNKGAKGPTDLHSGELRGEREKEKEGRRSWMR